MAKDEIILREVLRYINVPYHAADATLKQEILTAYGEIESMARIREVYGLFNIEPKEDLIVFQEINFQIESADLAKVVKNCNQLYVMAVTIGSEIDKRISGTQQTDMMKALIYNACANVLIEQACDHVEEEIMKNIKEGQYLTMRYSPGYGDVPLTVQTEILNFLDATRKAGITTTKAGMLIPLKSVTAFIGLSSIKEKRHKGCESCLIQDKCIYRKRGEKCGS
ncbi:vitamin B12 dependent-methionine synthase activation domain-containing protein [Niameybacter massiliensis]|uniref:vitamin B12 dependent-methionine synthase activation domain-containing protein n=1 Tax=Niameybacter massiliensis TaxID=1658108 RepID=UPI0006B5286B|nr:vitamin B12 dependent-methionine synthase activation domain-containing protein [Niameybacter massiliensis]